MSNSSSLIAQLDDLIAASDTADSLEESYEFIMMGKPTTAMHTR